MEGKEGAGKETQQEEERKKAEEDDNKVKFELRVANAEGGRSD